MTRALSKFATAFTFRSPGLGIWGYISITRSCRHMPGFAALKSRLSKVADKDDT